MQTNRAAENLQTIRTLMERSAIYRRALAPILLLAGAIGVVTAAFGFFASVKLSLAFLLLWLGAAAIAMLGAFLLARRQAVKDKEAFWSGPTRRVTQALSLPFLTGLFFSVLPTLMYGGYAPGILNKFIVALWMMFYGLALFTAGFFMPRAIKVFGTFFVISGWCLFLLGSMDKISEQINMHLLMGSFFGVLHLALGAYLYLTEKKNPAA